MTSAPAAGLRRADAEPGHEDLPDLNVSGAKGIGTGQQVIVPHALESLVVFFMEPGPGIFQISIPVHQRLVVMRTEVVAVLEDKEPVGGFTDLSHARQHTVREDIFGDPRIAAFPGCVGTDDMVANSVDTLLIFIVPLN